MGFNIILILKDLIEINTRFDKFLSKLIFIVPNNKVFNLKILIKHYLILFQAINIIR